jgi:hypothetical protein
MRCEPWTKVVVTAQHLHHTRREVLLCEFTKLQVAVRGEWRRLDNNGVSCDQCWGNLAASEMHGEIPWYDTNGDTKRSISDNNLLVIIFLNYLFLYFDLGQFANPVYASLDLSDSELVLDKACISDM